ncbi:hypothetical protein [Pseudomonas sp. AU10]|uniref:hypothetical protein n=1 Tax=Pseudomonas sp. AU10 TaxID=882697 RepID=UPI0040569DAE|nr:hypothetical protein [Pseudomonas sp. AU10]
MSDFVRCNGELKTEGGYPQCSGFWEAVHVQPPFDPSQLDPALLASAFGVGFILPATFIIMSIGIRAVLSFIKSD